MKKIVFYSLFIYFFMISCDRNENNIAIYSFSLLNNEYQNAILNINEKEGIIFYDYIFQRDTIRNLNIKYNTHQDILMADVDTFKYSAKYYNSVDFKFKIFQQKKQKRNNKFLFFNEEYGLLASIAIGSEHLFLKDSISEAAKEILFKALFLELNTMQLK